jgi:putative membrane protein
MLLFHHGDRFVGRDGWWWGFFGNIVPMLFFLVLVGLAVWAIMRLTARGSVPGSPPTAGAPIARLDAALEEVRIRYARGEIDREEFVQRSRDLGVIDPGAGQPPAPQSG